MNTTYISPSDVSESLGICYQKALNFIKYSGVPYVKIGRVYRVRSDILEKFITENNTINLKEAEYNACIRAYQKKKYTK